MNRPALTGLAGAALFALAGCTARYGLAEQGGTGGHITGSGTVLIIPVAQRGDPIAYSGDTVVSAFAANVPPRNLLISEFRAVRYGFVPVR